MVEAFGDFPGVAASGFISTTTEGPILSFTEELLASVFQEAIRPISKDF
jgi:hypothetical protein